jgi:hypothetical protein
MNKSKENGLEIKGRVKRGELSVIEASQLACGKTYDWLQRNRKRLDKIIVHGP